MVVCQFLAQIVLGLGMGQVAPNAPWYQDIPSYVTEDWGKSVTHPDVVMFDTPWNGWTYWMAYTPYPTDLYENPSIVVSADGVRWEVPKGLTNPVVAGPGQERKEFHHNCDPDMVYDSNKNVLRLYFNRTYTDSYAEVMAVESADGIHWSAPQKMFGMNPNPLSPAVAKVNDTWQMWYTNAGRIQRRQSTDGVTWSEPQNANAWLPNEQTPWHQDVIYAANRGEYWMALTTHPYFTVYFLRSRDGLVWDTLLEPLVGPGSASAWDGDHPYRVSLMRDKPGETIKIWYSAWGEILLEGEKKIGYTEVPADQVLAGEFVSADGDLDGLLLAEPSFVEIGSEGGQGIVEMTCGAGVTSWSARVTEGDDWLTIVSGQTGSGSGILTMTCNPNTSNSGRVGRIVVEGTGATNSPVEVEIHQPCNPCGLGPLLLITLSTIGAGGRILSGDRHD